MAFIDGNDGENFMTEGLIELWDLLDDESRKEDNMSNIATMISQSRKLVELGLDQTTANMYYPYLGAGQYGDTPRVGFPIEHIGGRDIPAWSLSALLEVISKVTCISYLTIDTSYLIRCKDLGFLWQKDIEAKDPITAAYEMVCWLLEQGFIKKGDEQ